MSKKTPSDLPGRAEDVPRIDPRGEIPVHRYIFK